MKTIINILLIFSILSCSSTTIVQSTDKNAQISINGRSLGEGSVIHSDRKVAWFGKNRVKISKAGCSDQMFIFKRNEELDVGALIFGIFLIVPLVWVMQYQAVHEYQFVCNKKAA